MMKYSLACAMFAATALIDHAEARVKTTWAQKRVDSTKYRLERNYGKGLVGLINEEGRVDPDRLEWMNKRPLASTINVTISKKLIIDASTINAYIYGFVNGMQYDGLARDRISSKILPFD